MTQGLAPGAVGIGLRAAHHQDFLATRPRVGFVEVHSENFFADGGPKLATLAAVRRDHALSLHGVGLSLGSVDPLDRRHLASLKALIDRFEPALVSEHACWSGASGVHLNDLLPMPFTEEALRHLAGRVRIVQDVLGRRILIENVSAYVAFAGAGLSEWEFLAALAADADCDLLLDVNNVYVSATNFGFDPWTFIRSLPAARIRELHVAGHTVRRDDEGTVLIDTHDAPVTDAVVALCARTRAWLPDVPLLLEWDSSLPSLAGLVAEARRVASGIPAAGLTGRAAHGG